MSRRSKHRDRRKVSVPHKKIVFPETLRFKNPRTGEPIVDNNAELTFEGFLHKLFQNPVWSKDWKAGLAQRSIRKAYKEAQDAKKDHMLVTEEDWGFLEACAKTPQVLQPGGLIEGFGYAPEFSDQVLTMQLAVIDATRED